MGRKEIRHRARRLLTHDPRGVEANPATRVGHMRLPVVPHVCVCALLWIMAVLAACARVIAWPSVEPDQDFVRRHIVSMETKPFDGVVLHAVIAGPEGTARSFTWSVLERRYSLEAFRPFVDTVRQVPFRRFKYNFLRINLNATDGPFDMFDEDRWTVLTANFGTAAAAAREAGLRGLMVDPEAYAEVTPETEIPRYNVFDFRLHRTSEDFPAYRRQAFLRGQGVGRAAVSAYPGITLILAFGPSATCLERGPLPERTYGLLGAFVDGLLAGVGGQATVVEGFESSYPYRSCDRFQKAYSLLRGPCRALSLDPAKYDHALEIGFGIWLDYDSLRTCENPQVAGRPCRWYDPSLYSGDERHLVDPEQFARAVASARGVSDGYVWIYTTEPKWWTEEHPLGENLPDAYVRALERGRHGVNLSCPRPTDLPGLHSAPARDQ